MGEVNVPRAPLVWCKKEERNVPIWYCLGSFIQQRHHCVHNEGAEVHYGKSAQTYCIHPEEYIRRDQSHLLPICCPGCDSTEDSVSLNWHSLKTNEEKETFDIASLRWRCDGCGKEFGVNDMEGQCITCKHNDGPTLPGGTLNALIGALCMNMKHVKSDGDWADATDKELIAEYPDNNDPPGFGGACFYRAELIHDSACPEYEKDNNTFRKYLGINMHIYTLRKTGGEAQ